MKAAIDVGSNSIRLLIGSVRLGVVEPTLYHRQITRLAGGLTPENRQINLLAVEESLAALQGFAEVAAAHNCQAIRAVATEALRRASNARDFVDLVRRRSGLHLEIIGGAEEAALSAAGARAALAPLPDSYLLFDIGGGSSEFILQHGEETLYQGSFPLGVVKLAEGFADVSARAAFIQHTLQKLESDLRQTGILALLKQEQTVLVGTAGTVTTLGAMNLQMLDYDWRRINNLQLDRAYLGSLLPVLQRLTPRQREALPGMEPKRGDLIVPGLEVVLAIMQAFNKDSLKVSDFGLLEGVLLSL